MAMFFKNDDTERNGEWRGELKKLIAEGKLDGKQDSVVIETNEDFGNASKVARSCADIFYQAGWIEKPIYYYFWPLEYLTNVDSQKRLEDRLENALHSVEGITIIGDIHQYFYDEQRSKKLIQWIGDQQKRIKSCSPVIYLVKTDAGGWLRSALGKNKVYVIHDKETIPYKSDFSYSERFEAPDSERIAPSDMVRPQKAWYNINPGLLQQELQRVTLVFPDYVKNEVYYLNGNGQAFLRVDYTYKNTDCCIFLFFDLSFPNAAADNVCIVPMKPEFKAFKKLHNGVLSYRYHDSFKKEVVDLSVKPSDVPPRCGYAETALRKYFDYLNGKKNGIKEWFFG